MIPSITSSPDPLNDSPTFYSPVKPRHSSRARSSLPMQGSSPKKQTFQLDVGNQLSPQKIRVTVEADGSDTENAYSPFRDGASSPTRQPVNRRIRTTTTTIPVKGLSDSEEEDQQTSPKKGRGRPRKSLGTPGATKKGRASTPTKKVNRRRRSVGELVDGDDSQDANFEIGQGVEIARGKGRSRSRSTKGRSRKPMPTAEHIEPAETLPSSATSKKGRGRRKTVVPEEVVVLEDPSSGRGVEEQSHSSAEDALEEIDINRGCFSSEYSNIRSKTTVGEIEPDIVIARFHPGNETPRRTGWSSPRLVDTLVDIHSRGENGEVEPYEETEHENQDYEDEQADAVGDMQEFDTILESEGFSMISVDSVPSLRDHLSSPVNTEERVPAAALNNTTLLSAKGQDAYEDSFSAIPAAILEAATPGRRAPNANLLSVETAQNDSSNFPPTVANTVTPVRKTLATKLLSRKSSRNSLANDSFSSIPPEILVAATPGKAAENTPGSGRKINANEGYNDSFSAIPPAVLDTATPAAMRKIRPTAMLDVPSLHPNTSRSASDTSRMLTPDETPSPSPEDSAGSKNICTADSEEHGNNSSFVQLPSSPPSVAPRRFTYTAHQRQLRKLNPDITQTPSIVFSSPSLPPPINFRGGQHGFVPTSQAPRPALSPILRAGRVLQDVVVPSSPRARSQSLGSPFKSPAATRRSSSILAQGNLSPLHERLAGPLPKLNLSSQLSERDSQHQLQEDVFGDKAQRPPSREEKQRYSLGLPEQRRYSDPRFESLKSCENSVLSDDAMSWQAEEEISVPESSSRANANDCSSQGPEQKWAAERAAVPKQVESADPGNVITINSDDGQSNDAEEEGEDFGLLLETLNSSSPAAPRPAEATKEHVERPRRGKIPSPWRKNSKRLVYSDEFSQVSSPVVNETSGRPTNISQRTRLDPITVRRITPRLSDEGNEAGFSGYKIPEKANFQPRVRATADLDLAALLASPMKQLPVLSTNSELSSKPQSHPPSVEPSRLGTKTPESPPGFKPIPQKIGFNPRPRSASSSPAKQSSFLPTIFGGPVKESSASSSQNRSSSVPQPLSTSSPSKTNTLSLSGPVLASSQSPTRAPFSPSVSDEDPNSSSLISPSEKENAKLANARTKQWTESLRLSLKPSATPLPSAAGGSPTKSCLRSPLKTPSATNSATPGKAVAFVSSSPMPDSLLEEQLSGTEWSDRHWLLLEDILLSHKPSKPATSSASSSSSAHPLGSTEQPKKRRNSTRVISKLLGRKVSGPGLESLTLEQWHLEAIDEFRGLVPGWEEKVIARRVFGLILGAKRRAERAAREKQERGESADQRVEVKTIWD